MSSNSLSEVFTRPVVSKWENTLTVYFGQVFRFETIDADDSGMSILFVGNQTNWAECMDKVTLHISPEDGTYDLTLTFDKPTVQIAIDFSEVSFEMLTTGQEQLVNRLHEAFNDE